MMRLRSHWAFLSLAGAGALWGLGFAFGKIALASMPVGAMIAFRFAVATIVLAPFLLTRRHFRIEKGDRRWFLLAALLFVPVQFLVQFEGLARTSVSHAALMVATAPAMLAIGSSLLARRMPSRTSVVAIAASIGGAALVAAKPGTNAHFTGDLLVVISLVAGISWVLLTQHRLNRYEPVASTALLVAIGTVALVLVESVFHAHDFVRAYPAPAWLAVCASGVLSTAAATLLWNVGLQRVRAAEAGVFVNLEPVIGTACGVLFFGDGAGWQLFAGGALVIAAALLITLRGERNDVAAHEENAAAA